MTDPTITPDLRTTAQRALEFIEAEAGHRKNAHLSDEFEESTDLEQYIKAPRLIAAALRAALAAAPGPAIDWRELLNQILSDTAKELGCEPDNEEILLAIDALKKRAPTLPLEPSEEAIDKAASVFWSVEPGVSHRAAIRWSLQGAYATDARPAAPAEGWKLLPIEPTEAMIEAGWNAIGEADATYRAMIDAAPPTPNASESERGWKPIDSAPRDGSIILIGFVPTGNLYKEDRRVFEGRWNAAQNQFTSTNGFLIFDSASHWQPLPAAPSQESSK